MDSLIFLICSIVIFLQTSSSEREMNLSVKWWTSRGFNGGDLWKKNLNGSYRICGHGDPVDTWLISRHVNLSGIPAELIYVDVEVEFTKCINAMISARTNCNVNFFEVYLYFGKPVLILSGAITLSYLSKNFNPIYNTTYNPNGTLITGRQHLTFTFSHNKSRKISSRDLGLSYLSKNISIHNTTNNPNGTLITGTQNRTFTFSHNKSEGVTFAIRSKGACGTLYRMEMYYYYCEETVINNVKIPKTISPANGSVLVNGSCSENSLLITNETNLIALCYYNGSWVMSSTNVKCVCIQGYNRSGDNCKPCEEGYFRWNISNPKCEKCLRNSTNSEDRTSCQCMHDHYSLKPNDSPLKCYAPLKIKGDAKADYVKPGSVNISWSAPVSNGLNENTTYDVECYICENVTSCNKTCSQPGSNNLTHAYFVFSGVNIGQNYLFKIYPKNNINNVIEKSKWDYTEVRYKENAGRDEPSSPEDEDVMIYYVAGAVALLLLIVIISLILCIFKRRGKQSDVLSDGFSNLELRRQRTYIRPADYATPDEAVMEFASELEPSELNLERLIGGGEFGDVYKGILTKPDDSKVPVAVKTLKVDASEKSRKDFLLEASMMAQFDHPNVVRLEGVVTKATPRMIVLEFVPNGSLDNYLKSNEGNLTSLQLIGMARGVAAGMEYLAEIQFVHRDLAARNILVDDMLFCKIADFGLSRVLENTESSRGEYATSGGRIPIRWTAPEAIKIRTFSSASDVWSYGILLWEIFSFAERPYWDWENLKVVEELEAGFRLPAPQDCPKAVHDLMLYCWQSRRSNRPSFSEITLTIDRLIRSPETMEEELSFSSTLQNWLRSIKMEVYLPYFVAAEYNNFSELFSLDDDALKDMGISLIGHRNKILKALVILQGQRAGSDRYADV